MKSGKTHKESARIFMTDLFHWIRDWEEKTQKTRNQWVDEIEDQIREFKDKKGESYQEYEKLVNSGNKAFGDLKRGFEIAMDSLSEAFSKASTHFK